MSQFTTFCAAAERMKKQEQLTFLMDVRLGVNGKAKDVKDRVDQLK